MYSPEGSADISDSEIRSAISGTTGGAGDSGVGKKRKRGEKRARGRPPKNGDDARSTTGTQKGAASTTGKADDAPEEEEDDEEDDAAAGRAMLDESAELMEEADRRGKEFLLHMPEWQLERHGTWKRAKLKTNNVRTLVNQTLSQSVPANVITVVAAYTKMFAGLIVEGARDVQAEWAAVAEKRPDGEDNHVAKKLRGEGSEAREKARVDEEKTKATEAESKTEKVDKMEVDGEVTVKNEHQSPKADDVPHTDDTQPDASDDAAAATNGDDHSMTNGNGVAKAPAILEASMGVRRQIEEVDRGPLLPDHLREALRRYKKAQYGGTVGFTGLSLEGKDNAAARMGGRKLFK
jgi:transcription initiation factor TFIID subunit 11